MPTTSNWKAANNGFPGNLDATNHAAQLSQFLGTHNIQVIRTGSPIVKPTNFTPGSSVDNLSMSWLSYGNNTDFDQPFTMPGGKTAIQRVSVAVNPVGAGADLIVSLHPDSAGSPDINTVLSSSKIPASHILALAAPNGVPAAGPVSTSQFNTIYETNGRTNFPWTYPASGLSFTTTSAASQSGSYLIFAGGINHSGTPLNSAQVYTQNYLGNGILDLPVLQPPLPQGAYYGAFTATNNFVVYTAGVAGGPTTQNTWVASWDSNTGQIGGWSSQAAFPQALVASSAAAYNNTVYVIGGYVSSPSTPISSVYYAVLNNGQLSSWLSATPLPVPLMNAYTAVIGNWLIVAGGLLTGGINSSTSLYYARISNDGSIGLWNKGPDMPFGTFQNDCGLNLAVQGNMFCIVGGVDSPQVFQSITFTDNGPSDRWVSSNLYTPTAGFLDGTNSCLMFPTENGTLDLVSIYPIRSSYFYYQYLPVPTISIPLPATGLTAGANYHVVLRQTQNATDDDYLQYGINYNMLPLNALSSPRHSSGAWSTISANYSMPMWVYEAPAIDASPILHTWEDPSSTGSSSSSNLASAVNTFTYTRFGYPLGIMDSTVLPNDPLNLNPTFVSGVTNWTPHNCTFTQSNAQVHGGFSFSGLMTPNGVSTAPNVTSELVPIRTALPTLGTVQWYTVNGWFYSPTGWATLTLSIDWYTKSSTYISTSSQVQSIAAATWTNIVNNFQPPSNAAFASINFVESGTPAAGNTVYFSNVTIKLANELTPVISGVNELSYNNGVWPAISVTQLA